MMYLPKFSACCFGPVEGVYDEYEGDHGRTRSRHMHDICRMCGRVTLPLSLELAVQNLYKELIRCHDMISNATSAGELTKCRCQCHSSAKAASAPHVEPKCTNYPQPELSDTSTDDTYHIVHTELGNCVYAPHLPVPSTEVRNTKVPA